MTVPEDSGIGVNHEKSNTVSGGTARYLLGCVDIGLAFANGRHGIASMSNAATSGYELLREAVLLEANDKKGALACYLQAIEYLLAEAKSMLSSDLRTGYCSSTFVGQKDDEKASAIREDVSRALASAERLKAVVEKPAVRQAREESDLLHRGVEIVKEAVVLDKEGAYEDALEFYERALELFIACGKGELCVRALAW